MSATHQRKGGHFLVALAVAGLVGGMSQSWFVFVVALASLLVAAFIAQDIRL